MKKQILLGLAGGLAISFMTLANATELKFSIYNRGDSVKSTITVKRNYFEYNYFPAVYGKDLPPSCNDYNHRIRINLPEISVSSTKATVIYFPITSEMESCINQGAGLAVDYSVSQVDDLDRNNDPCTASTGLYPPEVPYTSPSQVKLEIRELEDEFYCANPFYKK